MVTVKYPEFIAPRWFNSFPHSAVVENGRVKSDSYALEFKEGQYPDGTQVILERGRFDVLCRTQAEIEQEKQDRLEAAERSRRESLAKLVQLKAENLAFNESLNIPVQWSPDIKIVMSGLQMNSMCNGTKRNSVTHVVLREDLTMGRLKRKALEYLCSPPDLKYMSADEFWGDIPPALDTQKVNCKQCLKICEKFS